MLGCGGNILSPDVKTNGKNPKNLSASKITVLGLSDILKNDVRKRKLPVKIDEDDPPTILVKMDIQRSEIDAMSDIIFSGGLKYLNKFMIVWDERFKKQGGESRHIIFYIALLLP